MQILIALASALTTAIYFVYVSQVMKKHAGLSSTLTLAVSHLIGGAALLPVWWWFFRPEAIAPIGTFYMLMLLTAGLLVLSRQLYFFAYARTDVANITVFSALTPVYTLAIAFLLLDEVPSLAALVGILLICGSIYGMFLRRNPSLSLTESIVQPFRYVASSTPILCAFLSTIPTAFAATFQKKLLQTLDPFTFSLLLLLLIGLFTLAIALAKFKPANLLLQTKHLPIGFLLASATLLPLIHVLFCLVMMEHHTSVSLVVQRCSIVFQIIFAYHFLHERTDMGKRLFAGILITCGFGLVMSGL